MQRPIPFPVSLRRPDRGVTSPFRASAALRGFTRIRTEMSNDQLLAHLHGRVIDGSGMPRRINVYSIVDEGTHRWIQVGLQGADSRTALLKLAYLADDYDAVTALEEWLRDPNARYGSVVTVAPAM